jgi:HTH-type transcriptional regulator/antitoxin HipB
MATKPSTSLEVVTRSASQLGQALARLRERDDLSQSDLAKKAGLRQPTISKVERGAPHTEVETIFAMCAAMNLEIVVRPRPASSTRFMPEDIF